MKEQMEGFSLPVDESKEASTVALELHTDTRLWPQAGDHGPNALYILILALA